MLCGEFDVLLATEIAPRCTSERQVDVLFGSNCPQSTSGENVTEAEQLDPEVIEPLQVSVTPKSPMALMTTLVAVARPVFVNVKTRGALVVPTVWLPKLICETARISVGVPTNPVQARLVVCGLVEVLSTMVTVAVREPAAVGTQFSVIVQLLPAVTVPQPFASVKSPGFVPPSTAEATIRLALPLLTSVSGCAADVVPV